MTELGLDQVRQRLAEGRPTRSVGSTLHVHDMVAVFDNPQPALRPTMGLRTDEEFLFYPAAHSGIHGEPGCGKSWVALALVVERLRFGEGVIVVDLESNPRSVMSRLRVMGVEREHIERLRYVTPEGPLVLAEVDHLRRLRQEIGAGFVVVDSIGEALAHQGLDENAAADVTQWTEAVVRPLVRDGAAVLTLDHVRRDAAGRWARGSGAKLAVIDGVAYRLEAGEGFSRRSSGSAFLRVGKDREGAIGPIDSLAAEVRFEVADAGERMAVRFLPPPEDDGHVARSSAAKRGRGRDQIAQLSPEEIADVVSRCGGQVSFEQVRDESRQLFGVRREQVRALLCTAVEAGHLRQNSQGWSLVELMENGQ